MNTAILQALQQLSQIDQRIVTASTRKSQIESRLQTLRAKLDDQRKKFQNQDALFKESKQRQMLEEHRLKDEQEHIVERRKQLTALGAKAAKLMEREIDVASRSIESLEAKVLSALEDSDKQESAVLELRKIVEQLESEYQKESGDLQPELSVLSDDLGKFQQERDGALVHLEDRLKTLYNRLNSRFPGSAIAEAANGSCKACFRALPPQTYNQLRTGSALIQCPGCNRILVYTDSAAG